MPPTEAKPSVTQASTCPLCDTPLDPSNPTECPKCDWHVGYRNERAQPVGNVRDVVAVVLSVVPGLGHIYKGHRTTGILYLIGSVFAFAFCFLAGAASAGWGLLLMPLYWAGVMLQVYFLEDLVLKQHVKAKG